MGFKIKYESVNSYQFNNTLRELSNAKIDIFTSARLAKFLKCMAEVQADIGKEFKKELMPKFAKRDEHNNFNPDTFEVKEGMEEEFRKAQEDFGKQEYSVSVNPLTISDVKDINLKPIDIIALDTALDLTDIDKAEMQKLTNILAKKA